jgi:protoporphyrinogen oxidase
MKKVVIIGAGPAGLTAALELLRQEGYTPVVLEASDYLGGISRTVNYKNNRIDIGGHRFFSKSDRVMRWWMDILPVEDTKDRSFTLTYRNKQHPVEAGSVRPSPETTDRVMLVRRRKSRIYYRRTFFDYPISLSADTIRKLGLINVMKIGLSYVKAVIFPIRKERTLEDFLINRFGRKLYETFFQSYTEKVWGVPCHEINAEWGAQRIKGLSIRKTVTHFLKSRLTSRKDISQKKVETSLIERFLYPKLGPGQMWETVAGMVQEKGGELLMQHKVVKLNVEGRNIRSVTAVHTLTGETVTIEGDYFISTMPVQELVRSLNAEVPAAIRAISEGLLYRDFITVGLLVKKLRIGEVEDNWIYIQEPDVKVGRLQIFNNWSPYLVDQPGSMWIGLEYFCNEGDGLWNKPEEEMKQFAVTELSRIGIIDAEDVMDATVIKMPKTYPAYFGTYNEFGKLADYLDGFENLFLVGRNGMHKYNNQDHSMLTAMLAVENITRGITDKSNIWAVNTEQDYHEEK